MSSQNIREFLGHPQIVIPNKNLPGNWSPAEVLEFLAANKEGFFIDEKYIDVIRINEVPSYIFFNLNRQRFCNPSGCYKFPDGPATAIEEMINQLIHVKEREKQEKDAERKEPGGKYIRINLFLIEKTYF